jgi:lipopolysaccharide transport system ATP-binding protein
VLAVGDAAFQKKCLGKMGDVAQGGRTVLFVSHQMNSIRRLCDRCIWLDIGRIQMVDTTVKVVSAYEAKLTSKDFDDSSKDKDGYVPARFLYWELLEPKAEEPNVLTALGSVKFKTVVEVNKPIRDGEHGIALWNNSDNQLMWAWATHGLKLGPGVHEFVYTLPSLPLRPGIYSWHVSIYSERSLLDEWHCVPELIIATEPLTHPRDKWTGVLNMRCDFQVRGVESDGKNTEI